jgi:hypothetical protein
MLPQGRQRRISSQRASLQVESLQVWQLAQQRCQGIIPAIGWFMSHQ